jgi:hypothetical protein
MHKRTHESLYHQIAISVIPFSPLSITAMPWESLPQAKDFTHGKLGLHRAAPTLQQAHDYSDTRTEIRKDIKCHYQLHQTTDLPNLHSHAWRCAS